MYKQHSNRKPDFFAVLVLLVSLGFGVTVAIQVVASDVDHVVESLPVQSVEMSG